MIYLVMHAAVVIILMLIEIAVLLVFIFIFVSAIISAVYGAPYVPIGRRFIKDLLVFGGVTPKDIVIDLGSGDVRVLISAIKIFNAAEGRGYEGSPWPYLKSRWLIYRADLSNIRISYGNFFDKDLSEGTFVYAYLFPELMNRVANKLAKELKSGARILCPAFPIDTDKFPDLKLIKEEKI